MASDSQPASFRHHQLLSPVAADRFGVDAITFSGSEGFPRKIAKMTELAPGARLQFKTLADQTACDIRMIEGKNGTQVLVIDTSRCENDCQLRCDIPITSELLASAPEGSRFAITYQLTGSLSEPAAPEDLPIRGLNLIERGAQRREYQVRKKIRLAKSLSKHKIAHDFTRDECKPAQYELALRIVPKSGALCLNTISAKVREFSTPLAVVHQIGKRIQGHFPQSASPKLIVASNALTVSIDLAERGRRLKRGIERYLTFDLAQSELRRLLGPEDSFNQAWLSMWLDDALVAACDSNLSTRREAISAAELATGVNHNHELLKAAGFELRRFRNAAALLLLDRLQEPNASDRSEATQLKMRALLNARRFDDAVAVYEAHDPRPDDDLLSYSRYIEACASSERYDRLQIELEKLFFAQDQRPPEALAKLYRYSALLPAPCRAQCAATLLTRAAELRGHIGSILHIGHDFADWDDWQSFSTALSVLADFDLSDREKARVALLKAQGAHRFGHTEELPNWINQALGLLKVEPVALIDEAKGFALDNLKGEPTVPDHGGPLVSVIMTVFNSESTINYAIESVLAQSHAHLELLVVDDCSSDKSREIIAEWARRDRRVVPIFAARNAGTYVGKNLALDQTRGEFITCQDADDWAHPRKIETCLNYLRTSPDLVAAGAQVVRYSSAGGLQFRRDYIQPDPPSLLYRAEPVSLSLGYYDSVRAAADTEFERRMKLAFGKQSVCYVDEVLTLAAWSENSLTGGGVFAIDNGSGVMSRVRNAYRREFVRWHEAADSLYVDFPQISRPFPAPAKMVPLPK